MPRRPKPPSYRLHKPSRQAVVTIDGRDHYLGPYGSSDSHAAYASLMDAWRRGAEVRPAVPSQPDERRVVDVVAAFWIHATERYSASRERESFRPVLRLLRDRFGHLPARAFGPRALKEIRDTLVGQGRTRSAVNRLLVRVRTVFRWAVAEELVAPEVLPALAAVRGLRRGEGTVREGAPVRPVPRSDVLRTLPHLPPQIEAMVRLQLFTGMRPGEVCAMTPGSVDREGSTWWYEPHAHKAAHHGHSRRIPLVAGAQAVLAPYLLRPDDAACFSPAEVMAWRRERRHAERRTPLNAGNRPGSARVARPARAPGDRFESTSYARAVRMACAKAGVAPWSPNRIRHLVATEVRRSHGLEAARIVCGHSVVGVTERFYAEIDSERAAEVLGQLADATRVAG